MKKCVLVTFLFITGLMNGSAQVPPLAWAITAGGAEHDASECVVTDSIGSVYTTGYFSDTTDFDPSPNGTYSLIPLGVKDIFIQKVDRNGNLIWVKQMGANGENCSGSSIALDGFGNICVTGGHSGAVDFDPGTGVFYLSGSGLFIQKLDGLGNFIWAKNISVGAYSRAIKVDAENNIYVTGAFSDTVDFNPDTTVFNLISSGTDIFLAKLNSNGIFQWARKNGFNGTYSTIGNSLTFDASGDIFLTGTKEINTVGEYIMIQKLSSSGSSIWYKEIGLNIGYGYFNGASIVTDVDGNVLVTGRFGNPDNRTVDFDPGVGTFDINAGNGVHTFILKLTNDGDFIWAKKLIGNSNMGLSIALDASQNIYITGHFDDLVDFDPGPGANYITAGGDGYIFVLKLDSGGNFNWAYGTIEGYGNSIVLDIYGNIIVTGEFTGGDFDPSTSNYWLFSNGLTDLFIQKLGNAVGINESQFQNEFNLSPNPAYTTFDITSQLQNSQLEIYNLLGEKVYSTLLNNKEQTINCELFPTGIYFVKVQSEKGCAVKKLVVE